VESDDDTGGSSISKEKLTEQKIMKSNVLVTAKIRKLMLRIELWNIYEKIFLSNDPSIKNKNRAAGELLDDALTGQKTAQKRIATIFSSDGIIENWETVISKLKFFEDESDTVPLVSTEDTSIPVTEQLIQVRTSDDRVIKEVTLDYTTDTYQLACEIQVEHRLPADEIEYMQGMLQHEMLGLVRDGMNKQREKLKSIQKKTAIIEHLVMLNENVSMKFMKTSKMYDTSSTHLKATSAAASAPTTPSFQTGNRTPVSSKNRTLVHFNKLIIDERRKLDQVEQEMVKLFKKMGKMSAADYYKTKSDIPIFTNGKEIPPEKKPNTPGKSKNASSAGGGSAPSPSGKSGNRRASVSLRSVMMQSTPMAPMSLDEGDEDDEEGDTFGSFSGGGGTGGMFSPMKSPGQGLSSNKGEEEEEEEMNTFGLSDHEIEKKLLFRNSEKDRNLLILENKRLRDIINSADLYFSDADLKTKSGDDVDWTESIAPAGAVTNLDDGDLRGLISELNSWDIERDELDGQIDDLNDKKDEMKRKIQKQKERKQKKIADKEHLKLSMLSMSR